MVYVFKTKDKNGKQHDRWRFQYTDWQGKRTTASGTTSRKETEKLAARVQADQESIKKGWKAPPKKSDAPRSFDDIVSEYLDWGKTQGGLGRRPWAVKYAESRERFLRFWKNRLGLKLVSDLEGCLPRVEKVLRELQKTGKSGKTVQSYADGLAAFCDWSVDRDFLESDPLKGQVPFDSAPQSKLRSLTCEEARLLLDACPPTRGLLYLTAMLSGLRVNELAHLKVKHLNAEWGGVSLDALWTKNRKGGFQLLPSGLVDILASQSNEKSQEASLLCIPSHTARAIEKDLKAVGIPKYGPDGKLVFHSLRVTFCTLIDQAGASQAEAMALARHRPPNLTYDRYVKAETDKMKKLLEKVWDTLFEKEESITSALRKTAGSVTAYPERNKLVMLSGDYRDAHRARCEVERGVQQVGKVHRGSC